MLKIGVDLKPFSTGSKYRGIGTYSRELIRCLLEQENNVEYHFLNLYTPYDADPELDQRSFVHQYFTGPKVEDVGERQLFRNSYTLPIVEAEVQHFLQQENIDVMLFTSPNEYGSVYKIEWFQNVHTVGILYDLIPLIFPEQCLFDGTYRKDYEDSLTFLKGLDLILAISQSAKEDAIKYLGIPEEKIVVIYAGISSKFKRLDKVDVKEIKKAYGISDPFVLFAGGIDFKKNIEGLIKAYAMLDETYRKRYQLIIVGKLSEEYKQSLLDTASKHGLNGRVLCIGYVPLNDLIKLYNIAEIMAFPSLYEGFGLPVVEAMSCGTRVLTSSTSSLGEIAQGYATLVNPKSIKSIAKGLKTILDNPIETLEMAERSMNYASEFTWYKVAEITLASIYRLVENKRKCNGAYAFKVTEELLQSVIDTYVNQAVRLSEKEMQMISSELFGLQKNLKKEIISGKKRILFDMTVVSQWIKAGYMTGIGRVCKELMSALKKNTYLVPIIVHGSDFDWWCTKVNAETFEDTTEKVKLLKTDIYFMPEFQIRGVQVPKNHPSVLSLKEQGISCYAIIYDILPLELPDYFEKKTAKEFDGYIKEILTSYTGVLTDSKAVADELTSYCKRQEGKLGVNNLKVGYFHLGQDSFTNAQLENINPLLLHFIENSKVFLMVGTVEPRKGHELIFDAFMELWNQGWNGKLCILGHKGWNMECFVKHMCESEKYGKNVLYVEGATDSELKYSYEKSACLIQASAGEGFGLPIIEASSYNLPIICSDIPVFHEVAGEHALYFNRTDRSDIQRVIMQIEEGENVPESKNIQFLSWEDVANNVKEMILDDHKWYKIIDA